MNKLCYVTSFLDLNRENWKSFSRGFDKYFSDFLPYVELFKNNTSEEHELMVFIDKKHFERVNKACKGVSNIRVIPIDRNFLSTISPLWQRLDKEREVMESGNYKSLIPHRLNFPEHYNPEYTLINHAKIDIIMYATRFTDSRYFCWSDFGYFSYPERIPKRLIDIELLDKERINYTLISEPTDEDKDVLYTLQNAPERIGGFFFFGNRYVLRAYQTLFHKVHESLQKQGIVDDDQHLALRCYFLKPSLFKLHNLGGWHKALTHFQKRDWKLHIDAKKRSKEYDVIDTTSQELEETLKKHLWSFQEIHDFGSNNIEKLFSRLNPNGYYILYDATKEALLKFDKTEIKKLHTSIINQGNLIVRKDWSQ